ncbi:Uu.00g018510.m01.CDS01 [Anthostomella pinea]|uniref:Copper transport protein n=1 Tax=Anthostomella pinea TaxID=933095 RepID=A0AAI8VZ46_9PEZI|nr:Uu.00g018510.m01.CDS01 [Anthostomella pinea]
MSMATTTAMTDMSGMTMTTSSAMSSSTGDMGGMDMSSSTMTTMSSSDMAMVFFQSTLTPLYSMAWTPGGTGSYAGTCIFLIALALTHRVLIALRNMFFNARTQHHHQNPTKIESSSDMDGYPMEAAPEAVGRQLRSEWNSHPFRVATEATRAVFEVVIGGIGYLLMLAVMTMNVGYFLSVLGGIFLGALVAGRFGGVDANHH